MCGTGAAFPKAILGQSDEKSLVWRENYIKTFLERDMARLDIKVQIQRIERLWKMLAHSHGQILNASKLAGAVGVSSHTIKSYIHILQQTFLVRLLPPFTSNLKKRLVKSSKIYNSGQWTPPRPVGNRDFKRPSSAIPSMEIPLKVLPSKISCPIFPVGIISFYRTRAGAEMDLVMTRGQRTVAIEIKTSKSPVPTKGFWEALKDIAPTESYILAPVSSSYLIKNGVTIINPRQFLLDFKV